METHQGILIPTAGLSAPSSVHISGMCTFRDEGELRVIFANGIPLLHYARTDRAAEHYALIHLVACGLATQQEVAAAFGCARQTIFRAQRRYDHGGMAGLVPKKKGPKEGSKVSRVMERRIGALKSKGLTNAAIGSRLGLKEDTVRKALKRMGWSYPKGGEEGELPLEASPRAPLEIRGSSGISVGNRVQTEPSHVVKHDRLESLLVTEAAGSLA